MQVLHGDGLRQRAARTDSGHGSSAGILDRRTRRTCLCRYSTRMGSGRGQRPPRPDSAFARLAISPNARAASCGTPRNTLVVVGSLHFTCAISRRAFPPGQPGHLLEGSRRLLRHTRSCAALQMQHHVRGLHCVHCLHWLAESHLGDDP